MVQPRLRDTLHGWQGAPAIREAAMSFSEALATQPDWIRLWVLWMNVAVVGGAVALAIGRETRRDALVVVGLNALMVPTMYWLHAEVGYVRLLGLPHLIFWTPLVVWLVRRLRQGVPAPYRQVMAVLAATLAVSLAFDVTDVIRYALGERQSLIPAG